MGSLPHTRPHRRSAKRPQPTAEAAPPGDGAGTAGTAAARPRSAAKAAAGKAKPSAAGKTKRPAGAKAKPPAPGRAKPPAAASKPAAKPGPEAASSSPTADKSPGALETAVQAAAELTEIGLHAGARALRRTLSRLSR